MAVRDAVPDDVASVCALIEAHARYEGNSELALDRAAMAEHLFGSAPKAWVLVATADGVAELAGFALCSWSFSTWLARPGIWLDDLFVRPEFRGHGLGKELMLALRGRTDGRVFWEMQQGNDRAAKFYRALGAEPVADWVLYRWAASIEQPSE